MMEPELASVEKFRAVSRFRVQDHFVTGLCQDLKMMKIMTDLNFVESISYLDCVVVSGRLPPPPPSLSSFISATYQYGPECGLFLYMSVARTLKWVKRTGGGVRNVQIFS
jgi:hypothetical protein